MRERGIGAGVYLQAIARALRPLENADARQAFLHTLRAVIDMHGQRVSATDRLGLLETIPTLIVWGERDQHDPDRARPPRPRGDPAQPLQDAPRRGPLPAPGRSRRRSLGCCATFLAQTAAGTDRGRRLGSGARSPLAALATRREGSLEAGHPHWP